MSSAHRIFKRAYEEARATKMVQDSCIIALAKAFPLATHVSIERSFDVTRGTVTHIAKVHLPPLKKGHPERVLTEAGSNAIAAAEALAQKGP